MRFYPFSNYPVEILLKKVFSRGFAKARRILKRRWDLKQDHRAITGSLGELRRYSCTEVFSEHTFLATERQREFFLRVYREHRFDILGSGWIEWSYSSSARGMEGWKYDRRAFGTEEPSLKKLVQLHREEHRQKTADILDMIDDADYRPIDWQRDLRSGFRWSEKKAGLDQESLSEGITGADPKLPFELGRLQHLPRLAFLVLQKKDQQKAMLKEFRSQTLDFIAMNPPGMGIQWTCPMDVGIRAVNLLIAWDLFKSMDEKGSLDESFENCLKDSLQQHAYYLERNLEYQDGLTGNHYLFNVLGLLFIAAYMPEAPGSDARLGFAIRETVRELFKQVLPGGGNFEGSTAYHRLVTEMFVHSASLIHGLKDRLARMGWDSRISLSKWSLDASGELRSTADTPLPPAFLERLRKMMSLNQRMTKPDGRHPQIGDNDSGVLFRLTPLGSFRSGNELNRTYAERAEEPSEAEFFDEDLLSMEGTNNALRAFQSKEGGTAEAALVLGFLNGTSPLEGAVPDGLPIEVDGLGKKAAEDELPHQQEEYLPFPAPVDLRQGKWEGDPQAGWFFYSVPELFLIMNAPPGDKLRHTWGHVHNDRTGIELWVHGQDLLLDPGSYVYGALPEWRNAFRGVAAHNVPIVNGMEQNRWREGRSGLFFLYPESKCTLLGIDGRSIRVHLHYRRVKHIRELVLDEQGLTVRDRSDHPFEVNFGPLPYYSRGYGKRTNKEGKG